MTHAEHDRSASEGHLLYLVLPPTASYARSARNRVLGFVRDRAIPEIDAFDFLTAFGEALANAIEHARSGNIEITCRMVGAHELVATVVDSGIGFDADPALIGDAHLPPVFAERGRGFAIMKECTDHVVVNSVPGKGTSVVLTRFIRPGRMQQLAGA